MPILPEFPLTRATMLNMPEPICLLMMRAVPCQYVSSLGSLGSSRSGIASRSSMVRLVDVRGRNSLCFG